LIESEPLPTTPFNFWVCGGGHEFFDSAEVFSLARAIRISGEEVSLSGRGFDANGFIPSAELGPNIDGALDASYLGVGREIQKATQNNGGAKSYFHETLKIPDSSDRSLKSFLYTLYPSFRENKREIAERQKWLASWIQLARHPETAPWVAKLVAAIEQADSEDFLRLVDFKILFPNLHKKLRLVSHWASAFPPPGWVKKVQENPHISYSFDAVVGGDFSAPPGISGH
jgi:hypothetical protein